MSNQPRTSKQHRNGKKILGVAIAGTLLFALTACGSGIKDIDAKLTTPQAAKEWLIKNGAVEDYLYTRTFDDGRWIISERRSRVGETLSSSGNRCYYVNSFNQRGEYIQQKDDGGFLGLRTPDCQYPQEVYLPLSEDEKNLIAKDAKAKMEQLKADLAKTPWDNALQALLALPDKNFDYKVEKDTNLSSGVQLVYRVQQTSKVQESLKDYAPFIINQAYIVTTAASGNVSITSVK